LAVLELTALAEEFNAFKTFQDTATGGDAAFAFQTWMLAHKLKKSAHSGGRIRRMQSHSLKKSQRLSGWRSESSDLSPSIARIFSEGTRRSLSVQAAPQAWQSGATPDFVADFMSA
jgi:hypothetical protein